jgi:hypothetical protein
VVQIHNNFVSIKNYVAQGMGIAILSGHALSPEDGQRFDIFSLDRYFPKRKYGILLKKKKYLASAVKAFIRFLKPEIDLAAPPALSAAVPPLRDFLRQGRTHARKAVPAKARRKRGAGQPKEPPR